MPDRRFLAELVALVAAATLCAFVANAVAARERRLAWAADYPNARVVPQRTEAIPAAEVALASAAPAPSEASVEPESLPPTSPSSAAALALEASPAPGTAVPAPARASERAAPPAAPAVPKFTLADFPADPSTPSVEISSEQARALYALGVPFLDARRSSVYAAGHVKGARSMPVWESDIDERVMRFYEEGYPQESPLVVYCSGGACEDSHMLAQKLWGIGYNNVLVYTDGWPDWQAHGMPIEQGAGR